MKVQLSMLDRWNWNHLTNKSAVSRVVVFAFPFCCCVVCLFTTSSSVL